MSPQQEHERWINYQLIPSLVADGRLALGPDAKSTKLFSVESERVSVEEAFMLTACYKVKVTLSSSSNGIVATDSLVRLVVKITPDVDEEEYEGLNLGKLFISERFAYEKIFPKLGWSGLFPKYYGSEIGRNKAHIVLGDFNQDGWRLCKQRANLSLEHILVSMTELGKFHGVFYALKHTDRSGFDHLKGQLITSRFGNVPQKQLTQRMNIGPKRVLRTVRNHPDTKNLIPEEYLSRMEALLEDMIGYLKARSVPKEPLAIISHGDFLRNNIAFKYKADKPDVPEAAMMFDFQTVCYTSPMVDLAHFIANSTGVDVRREHFDLIFGTYHSALIRHFCEGTQLNEESVPDFLQYDNILKEYAEYTTYGLSTAASFLLYLHDPDFKRFEEFALISEEEDARSCFERGGETVNRELRALVKEMYELQMRFGLEL